MSSELRRVKLCSCDHATDSSFLLIVAGALIPAAPLLNQRLPGESRRGLGSWRAPLGGEGVFILAMNHKKCLLFLFSCFLNKAATSSSSLGFLCFFKRTLLFSTKPLGPYWGIQAFHLQIENPFLQCDSIIEKCISGQGRKH